MKTSFYYMLWALAGAVVLLVLVLFVFRFQPQSVSAQVAAKAKLQDAVGEMRIHLASAIEDEKSAVLAITDSDSQSFADEARAETIRVDGSQTALKGMLQSDRERGFLEQFATEFSEFKRVDKDLLDLAVQNTNLKAYALAFGPSAHALDDMDGALTRLVSRTANSPSPASLKIIVLAEGADVGVLRIATLLPPHIAEQSDVKMNELEARMKEEDRSVRDELRELALLLPANQDVAVANSRYRTFSQIESQILELSRANSNVKSLSISLTEMRKVADLCQDTLSALEASIEGEQIPGEKVEIPR